jgi:hypothetical protein
MQPGLREPDQLLADSLLLIRHIHRKIGQVTTVAEVSQGPGDSNENITIPSSAYEIRVSKHVRNALRIVDRTTLRQG